MPPMDPSSRNDLLYRRRRWLKISSLGWLGASLLGATRVIAGQSPSSVSRSPIKSCILVFYYGGPSHLDTFDPKPLASVGIRGEYQTLSTAVHGITVCEALR